ncbi:flagellar hook-basal body complex protein FliE [Thioclava sp. ES.031]|uniref:Flagellar hook-basal body complex protein FliE n=1 Tax=Thioclava electrotropha TaxID=1549850 RepID=A0ABX6YQ71_9RHOB|nr:MULTISPECIES: flagellar hook-basal body complex protein FliE [Thioclava]MAQ35777.1 flagellar biosynthesis protein [Thioclava sp.]PFG61907.1 flagellar hook-basal body complex protein FliE [Thioclava sp. ES.031]QPZ89838.1 flagellar biosynthesis protein [Thioclava electrotropha]
MSDPVLSNAAIRGAYGASRSLSGGPASAHEAKSAGQSFGDMLKGAAEEAVQTMRAADTTAQAGLTGQASTQQVVEATMAMESTVKVTVAMRDKLVEAYQEIMRMPI